MSVVVVFRANGLRDDGVSQNAASGPKITPCIVKRVVVRGLRILVLEMIAIDNPLIVHKRSFKLGVSEGERVVDVPLVSPLIRKLLLIVVQGKSLLHHLPG